MSTVGTAPDTQPPLHIAASGKPQSCQMLSQAGPADDGPPERDDVADGQWCIRWLGVAAVVESPTATTTVRS